MRVGGRVTAALAPQRATQRTLAYSVLCMLLGRRDSASLPPVVPAQMTYAGLGLQHGGEAAAIFLRQAREGAAGSDEGQPGAPLSILQNPM